jgi:hypothetical protein
MSFASLSQRQVTRSLMGRIKQTVWAPQLLVFVGELRMGHFLDSLSLHFDLRREYTQKLGRRRPTKKYSVKILVEV